VRDGGGEYVGGWRDEEFGIQFCKGKSKKKIRKTKRVREGDCVGAWKDSGHIKSTHVLTIRFMCETSDPCMTHPCVTRPLHMTESHMHEKSTFHTGMKQTFRTWMSRVSQVNESHMNEKQMLHTWMQSTFRTLQSRVSQVNEASHEWVMSQFEGVVSQFEWVVSHMWNSHVTHVNESCHRWETVMSRMRLTSQWGKSWMSRVTIWMSHVTHVEQSCHACEWVMSHIWISHVTFVNESCHTCKWGSGKQSMCAKCHTRGWAVSCHTYKRVMPHIWTSHVTQKNSHVTRMNESRPTSERGTWHVCMSHVSYEWVMSHMNESCLLWMSHVSYEWVMSHMNESCLIWISRV